MSRGLSSSFATAIGQPSVRLFPLLQMDTASGTVYLAGVDHDVVYGGNTYLGALGVVSIDVMEETSASVQGLRINIMGAPTTNVSLALSERVQGRTVTVRLCAIDAAGAVWADDNVWQGLLDTMTVNDTPQGCAITITAEHMLAAWDRPRPLRYTDAQQQALYAGDLGLQYVAAMAEAQIVWPGAAFFKQ